MLAIVKPLAAVLLMPLPIALALILIGAVLLAFGRRRGGFGFAGAGVVLIALAAWSPVADRLLEPLEQTYKPVLEVGALEEVAAVVVLGAGWEPDADWPAGTRLNESSVHRLMEGLRLLQGLPEAAPLVVTGASRRTDVARMARGPGLCAGGAGAGGSGGAHRGARYADGHRAGGVRGAGGPGYGGPVSAGYVGVAHAALGAAFRAGGARADSGADALPHRTGWAGPAVVLGAIVRQPGQDGTRGARVPGAVALEWDH
jgi:hypothetical protein